jgi:hypothetical protein
MGFGCDNALRSANRLVDWISENPAKAAENYAKDSAEYISKRIRNASCLRVVNSVGYNYWLCNTVLDRLSDMSLNIPASLPKAK